MSFSFSKRSEQNLRGVHPDLVRVCRRAIQISRVDFGILCGLRTKEQQAKEVREGDSRTMNSRHLTGHAIDYGAWVGGAYINGDTPAEYRYYEMIAEAFKTAALELRVPIIWGGDWKDPVDGGHIELDRRKYP